MLFSNPTQPFWSLAELQSLTVLAEAHCGLAFKSNKKKKTEGQQRVFGLNIHKCAKLVYMLPPLKLSTHSVVDGFLVGHLNLQLTLC